LKHSVVLHDLTPVQGIELKNRLIADGLIQEQDFIWSYMSPIWDNFSQDPVDPRRVEFKFRDPALATFYQLKWSR
jgi:hypothetical protein